MQKKKKEFGIVLYSYLDILKWKWTDEEHEWQTMVYLRFIWVFQWIYKHIFTKILNANNNSIKDKTIWREWSSESNFFSNLRRVQRPPASEPWPLPTVCRLGIREQEHSGRIWSTSAVPGQREFVLMTESYSWSWCSFLECLRQNNKGMVLPKL